ncbi:MAG: chorismate synthase [Allosphingosinicella sp.]
MSFNTFGRLFRFTSWGESHGPAIGAVIDGCPPGLSLGEDDIQPWLDRRRPGLSKQTSPRQEPDRVRILSGTYEGRTTGTPISLLIDNVDARPKDYAGMPPRAGHADAAYQSKYGLRDPRGGGRASARETAARVAAGAVARLVVPEVTLVVRIVRIGDSPDESQWERLLDEARSAGSSLGALIECTATGVPSGWGAPVYAKLDSDLAAALMSINAVKAVEIGAGFGSARLRGEDNQDPSLAGGIAGGISTGDPIVVRAAFKPTPSVAALGVKGRHDPCVGIRGAPVVEAMVALVLADHKLLHRAQCG